MFSLRLMPCLPFSVLNKKNLTTSENTGKMNVLNWSQYKYIHVIGKGRQEGCGGGGRRGRTDEGMEVYTSSEFSIYPVNGDSRSAEVSVKQGKNLKHNTSLVFYLTSECFRKSLITIIRFKRLLRTSTSTVFK